jgi:type I restriction enzyme S subunit
MREMKNSGIFWLGEVPNCWNIERLKNIKADIPYAIVDGPFGSAISTEDYVDEGTPLVRIVNLKQPGLTRDNIRFITAEHAETVKRSSVYLNDIIFAKTGATVGKCAINDLFDLAILSSSCVKISIDKKYNTKYFYYLFCTNQFNEALRNACNGTTRDTINLKPFGEIACCVPSVKEQDSIVAFLDKSIIIIDKVMSNQKTQIEKLKQYKQSLITEVVTKGLNPDAEMKDSGVEWIGKIPSHWNIIRGKAVLENLSRKVEPEMEVITCFRDGEVTLRKNRREEGFTFSDKEIGYQGIYPGDLVVHGMDGFAGAIGISDSKGKGSPILIVCNSKENKDFLMYYLRNLAYRDIFLALSTGIRVRSCDLRWNKLSVLPFVIPPRKEQDEIIEYLNKKCAQIDNLIKLKQSKIAKLNEYKKSLIYEYVTGKKEVQ